MLLKRTQDSVTFSIFEQLPFNKRDTFTQKQTKDFTCIDLGKLVSFHIVCVAEGGYMYT